MTLLGVVSGRGSEVPHVCSVCSDAQDSGSCSMIDSLESRLARSSGELWSEICSGLPAPEGEGVFADSFQPQQASLSDSSSGVLNSSPWAPMADSEVYLASLGECVCVFIHGSVSLNGTEPLAYVACFSSWVKL